MENPTSTARINTRIDPEIKRKAQEQLAQHGLTMSEFMRIVVTTVANNGLPEYYGFPNAEVVESLNEVMSDLEGSQKLNKASNRSELEQLLSE